MYKPCLERVRWLNCSWNGARESKIVSKHMYQFHWLVSLTGVPGLQIWHGHGELESKTHTFYIHFLFKHTYIQTVYLSLPQFLCLLHWKKNGVDKICVNTLFRNWKKSTIQINDRLMVQNERFFWNPWREHFNRCWRICSNQTWNKNLFDVTDYPEIIQDMFFTHVRYMWSK